MIHALLPLLAPVMSFLCHASYIRLVTGGDMEGRSPQKITFFCCISSTLIVTLISYSMLSYTSIESLVLTLVYVFSTSLLLSYWYFHVFNMSETARRIHILMGVYEDKVTGKDNTSSLSTYNPDEMVEVRVQRSIEMGQAFEKDGKLYVKYGILFYASCFFSGLRRLLFGEIF